VQELNEYLQAVKLFTDPKGVDEISLTFFIKNELAKKKEHKFSKFTVTLSALRAGGSPDLK